MNKIVYSPDLGCTGLISEKVERNSLCKCGSNKKAKHCCGSGTRYKNRQLESIEELKSKVRKIEKLRDGLKETSNKMQHYNEIIKDLNVKIEYMQRQKNDGENEK